MSAQASLPFARNPHEARYREWASVNTDVLGLCLRYARERMAQGRPFGIKALWERVRWDAPVATARTDGFRLNNNHVSYVARDLIAIEPRLARYITTRRVEGET